MLNFKYSNSNLLYLSLFAVVLITLLYVIYKYCKSEYKETCLLIEFLLINTIIMIIIPQYYKWIPFILLIFLIKRIVTGTNFQEIFRIEEDAVFINKEPQVWDTFEIPPELKINKQGEKS